MVNGPYLLDTCTMIWALADPERLSTAARKALETGPLVLSVASYWEVVIKARKSLVRLADPVSWWGRANALLGGTVLSIRAGHISALHSLPDIHNDPFDRILIAQASAEGLALITPDEQIRRYSVRTAW